MAWINQAQPTPRVILSPPLRGAPGMAKSSAWRHARIVVTRSLARRSVSDGWHTPRGHCALRNRRGLLWSTPRTFSSSRTTALLRRTLRVRGVLVVLVIGSAQVMDTPRDFSSPPNVIHARNTTPLVAQIERNPGSALAPLTGARGSRQGGSRLPRPHVHPPDDAIMICVDETRMQTLPRGIDCSAAREPLDLGDLHRRCSCAVRYSCWPRDRTFVLNRKPAIGRRIGKR